ncbi:MAG: hypothetical protein Q6363_010210 [Candidatus Njordarchaeota archaeon]
MASADKVIKIANAFLKKADGSYRKMLLAILDANPNISLKYIPYSLTTQQELLSFIYYDSDNKKFKTIDTIGQKYKIGNILASDYTEIFYEMGLVPLMIIHTHPTTDYLSRYLSINDMLVDVSLMFPYFSLFYLEKNIFNAECRIFDFRKAILNSNESFKFLLDAYMQFGKIKNIEDREKFLISVLKKLEVKVYLVNIGE